MAGSQRHELRPLARRRIIGACTGQPLQVMEPHGLRRGRPLGGPAFIVATATARPESLGQPFTRWSLRKLVAFLADNDERVVKIGRERLRQILDRNEVTFQRTKTWKESNDPDRDAKLDRIEEVLDQHPDRCFAFDEFGPLTIRPVGGSCWSPASKPQRVPGLTRRLSHPREPLWSQH